MHEPTNATSTRVPAMGAPPVKPMKSSASSTAPPSAPASDGVGMRSETPTDWPGLMPHVTRGSMAPPSSSTTSSYAASASEAIDRHHARARSNAAPPGANGRPARYSNVVSSGFT